MTKPLEEIQQELRECIGPSSSIDKVGIGALLRQGKAIYGPDSRTESSASSVPGEVIRSVCILLETDRLRASPGGYGLITQRFGDAYKLCPGEAFSDQPVLGYGTGFLIARDVVATAGHCVDGCSIANIAFIFDYEVRDGSISLQRGSDDVYFAKEVIAASGQEGLGDYALLRLDRAVSARKPLTVSPDAVSVGDSVYIIGHPAGLPKKVATDASVTDVSADTYFVANLDAFGGNSGSPVLDKHHHVRGILVRGEPDFVMQGDCRIAATFPLHKGGEHVCRASLWLGNIKSSRGARTQDVSTIGALPVSDNISPRKALEDYLLAAYSTAELRRMVSYSTALEGLLVAVNFRDAKATVVADLVSAMRARQLVDGAFFELLRQERPHRRDEVDAVEIRFNSSPTRTWQTAEVGDVANSHSETRQRAREALRDLAPGDWESLVEFELEKSARHELSGIPTRRSQIVALINYFDVPHRGLGKLTRLVDKIIAGE